MNYQTAYKLAEKINDFFNLNFGGKQMSQLSQILIDNTKAEAAIANAARRFVECANGTDSPIEADGEFHRLEQALAELDALK